MSKLTLVIYLTGNSQIHVSGTQADLNRLIDVLETRVPEVFGTLLAGESVDQDEPVEECLSCDMPRVDSGEGRFCIRCNDHEGTCVRDHCLACGGAT